MRLLWTYPWAILLAVPLIGFLCWTRSRPRAAVLFASLQLVPHAGGRRAERAKRGGFAFRVAVGILLVLGLAGPRIPDEKTKLPTEGIALAVVLDVSTSMAEADFFWENDTLSRLEAAQKILKLFLEGSESPRLPGRFGELLTLITYAARPETVCPLTLDHSTLLEMLHRQKPRLAAGEGTTNPGDAVAWALAILKDAPARRKAILLVTDGESNVPEGMKPFQAGQLALNLKIPVYTLDVAPKEIDPAKAGDAEKARESLQKLAKMTEGVYFHASNGEGLIEAARRIGELEKSPFESLEYRRYYELGPWLAGLALILWGTLLVLETTWWRSLP